MKCGCGATLSRAHTDFVGHWGDGPYVRVEQVPVWECERCGWREFDPEVVDELQRLARAGTRDAIRVEEIAVKRFAEAGSPATGGR